MKYPVLIYTGEDLKHQEDLKGSLCIWRIVNKKASSFLCLCPGPCANLESQISPALAEFAGLGCACRSGLEGEEAEVWVGAGGTGGKLCLVQEAQHDCWIDLRLHLVTRL